MFQGLGRIFVSQQGAIAISRFIEYAKLLMPPELGARDQPPQAHSVIAIRISPGSVKGVGSTTAQFKPPSNGSTINLIFELPGQSSLFDTRCESRWWTRMGAGYQSGTVRNPCFLQKGVRARC